MDEIAVIIPCYNEASTIAKVVYDFRLVLPMATIYVYDNNSSDGSGKAAEDAGAIVRYEYRQGKGNVIRSMFRDINAKCYIMIDGDDTYPVEFAKKMADEILLRGGDMVIGDRLSSTYFVENKRAFHNSGNMLVRKLINIFFRSDIKDIMTGYRAFSYDFVKSFPVLSHGFEIETEMTIHALDRNFVIRSIPVTYRDRPEGSFSKLNTFTDGFKVLLTIFKLYKDYQPLRFFSIIAGVLFLFSLIFFIPVIVGYVETGLVPKMPSFLASCVLFVISILLFICGLILDTENLKNRQNFEIQLNIIRMLKNILF